MLFSLVVIPIILAPFFVCADTLSPAESDQVPIKTGTVSGKLVDKQGAPLTGGQVVFYGGADGPSPDISKYIRVPNLVVDIAPDGSFTAIIPEGEFYFRAIKRKSARSMGPPEKEDLFFLFREKDSLKPKKLSIKQGEHIDFGTMVARSWLDRMNYLEGKTAIKGTIYDLEGNPVQKGIVFAFARPDMLGTKPLFVSNETGPDGRYIIHVKGGETYFLLARDLLGGGQLRGGDIIGIYGGLEPIGIQPPPGKTVANIDITVEKLGHRGPDIKPGEQKIDLKNIGSKKPTMLPPEKTQSYQKKKN